MAYKKTNIGDSGQALVNNLDNNFVEIYGELEKGGLNATIEIGEVTTVEPSQPADVINVGNKTVIKNLYITK